MYGGFNNLDYILSKKAIASGTKYIAECNYFGFPTEPLMRYNIEQVTDIINNKRVLAPKKDILEVKNAIEVYSRIKEFKVYQ
jgi:hypothetical protein